MHSDLDKVNEALHDCILNLTQAHKTNTPFPAGKWCVSVTVFKSSDPFVKSLLFPVSEQIP